MFGRAPRSSPWSTDKDRPQSPHSPEGFCLTTCLQTPGLLLTQRHGSRMIDRPSFHSQCISRVRTCTRLTMAVKCRHPPVPLMRHFIRFDTPRHWEAASLAGGAHTQNSCSEPLVGHHLQAPSAMPNLECSLFTSSFMPKVLCSRIPRSPFSYSCCAVGGRWLWSAAEQKVVDGDRAS